MLGFKQLNAAFRLARPLNVVIAMLSVFVAILITHQPFGWRTVLLACLSTGLIMAAGNTINDYFDVEIDRINRPDRPLPAAQISKRSAYYLTIAEFLLGNILAFSLSLSMGLVAAFCSLLIYVYSWRLKRIAFWGNFAVSLATAATFIYGALAVGHPVKGIIPGLFAFLFHFAREIIKDIADIPGDRQAGADTFPIRYGKAKSIVLVNAAFLLLLVTTIYPYATDIYGRAYMAIVAAGIWPVILYVTVMLKKATTPGQFNRLSNILKYDMIIGLIALLAG
jgi:geranylgeranylglycerol-phosphate geranylgeranyltransferase